MKHKEQIKLANKKNEEVIESLQNKIAERMKIYEKISLSLTDKECENDQLKEKVEEYK